MGEHPPERERGSVLMLVPAAVLVLIVLGAIAVDFSIAFLGQRELTSAAAAAANDAAAAISERSFYQGQGGRAPGTITVDEDEAARVVDRAVRARTPRGVEVTGVSVDASERQVCVSLEGRVEYVFAKAVPGIDHRATVRGRSIATAVTGPAGSAVERRAVC